MFNDAKRSCVEDFNVLLKQSGRYEQEPLHLLVEHDILFRYCTFI